MSGKKWQRVQGKPLQTRPAVTNHEFAARDEQFKAACGKANVKPTARQASKYRMKMGSAYKAA